MHRGREKIDKQLKQIPPIIKISGITNPENTKVWV